MKSINRYLAIIVFFALVQVCLAADTFKIDPSHSTVGFSIRHIFNQVHGRFTKFSGSIQYDSTALDKFAVDLVVQDSSITTGNDGRDVDLRDTSFFFVDSLPTSTFKSVKAYKNDQGMFLDGKLTIRGVTKDITVPVEILGVAGTGDRVVAGFQSTFKINRKDYGIAWNRKMDTGTMLL